MDPNPHPSQKLTTSEVFSSDASDEEEVFEDALSYFENEEPVASSSVEAGAASEMGASCVAGPSSAARDGMGKVAEKQVEHNKKALFYIHPILENYRDCFFDWMPLDLRFTRDTAQTVASVLLSKYSHLSEDDLRKELAVHPYETVANHLSMAFCYLLLKEEAFIEWNLRGAKRLIRIASENGHITVGHSEGLVYLYTGLEGHNQALSLERTWQPEMAEANLRRFLSDATPYAQLTEEGRFAIKCVRGFFLAVNRINEERRALIESILETAPNNVEWLVQYHYVLSLIRKEEKFDAPRQIFLRNKPLGPSVEEKQVILKLLSIDPSCPNVKVAVCRHLIDVIRTRQWEGHHNVPLELPPFLIFNDMQEIVNYIIDAALFIMDEMPHSVKLNLYMADFILKVPQRYQDKELARACFVQALGTNPSSSKAHHKFGLFYLLHMQMMGKAIRHFQLAYEHDPRNFPAFIDLVQTLMRDRYRNRALIDQLFSQHWDNKRWNVAQRANLYTLFALWKFMNSRERECIRAWSQAYSMSPTSLHSLRQLDFHIKRYSWNLNPKEVESFVARAKWGQLILRLSKEERECLAFAHDCIRVGFRKTGTRENEGRAGQQQLGRNEAPRVANNGNGQVDPSQGNGPVQASHSNPTGVSNPSGQDGNGNQRQQTNNTSGAGFSQAGGQSGATSGEGTGSGKSSLTKNDK